MTDPASTSTTTSSPARRPLFSATDLALVAAFAALISALAYVGAIPVGGTGVPITLQTLGVGLAGALLGPLRGFAAVALYLALGAIGLPVFAEHSSGVGVFTGISAGYLYAFPLAALLIGALVKYVARDAGKTRAIVVFACAFAGSVLVIHPLGIAGMKLHQDVSWATAAGWDGPFWVGDVLKTTVVALVAAEVHRAFPQLLRRG
ncbi:BioY protein [Aeromicrobium sp. Root495]|uniref:biotin transporter BioY n=1 Tax=Aeromicrobium sp. Root495 TaxID=1736550 RepID=UPI00070078DF|nr:biotin transporter BioY [Aeromicrobium sp. Root495]KQY56215.1 BioY protein [Aeromicrobium sp. Root495]RYJ06699.1 MAG: biotin transporter BioY [Actinomycetales bacterium]